jgi:D-hydroxyproline dehydrogenase
MTAPENTLIIGGGVIGLNIALQIQSQGHQVTLIDDANRGQSASYGNAGHIATEQIEPLASMDMVRSSYGRLFMRGGPLSLPPQGISAWLPFSLRLIAAAQPERFARGKAALSALIAEALPAWRRRVDDVYAPSLLREDGHFVVWETPESAARGLKSWASADTGTARFRRATTDEMSQLSSLTRAEIFGAIRFEETAQIADTKRMLEALESRFLARGGAVINAQAQRLERGSEGARVLLSDGIWHTADAIVISAGVGSKTLMQQIGIKTPMIAERGYHIQSASHGWPQGQAPVVFEDRSMIVTGFESALRAASFVELNHAHAAPDPRKWQRLRKHVADLGLPFGEAAPAQWIGCRPTLPDYLPAIGRVAHSNLYYAFGHQHLGLTLGAVTGEVVAGMIKSGVGPKAFDLMRFK